MILTNGKQYSKKPSEFASIFRFYGLHFFFCVEKNFSVSKYRGTMEDTKRSISQIQQQQQQPQLVTTNTTISTIDFEMNRITETMIQYKVRRNMESYGKRYVTWMGCYLLLFLVCLSVAILVTVSIGEIR
jgi:hypothetical protein